MPVIMTVRYECRKIDLETTFASCGKNFTYELEEGVAQINESYVCTEDSTATTEAVIISVEEV